jgi:hypothetical protein
MSNPVDSLCLSACLSLGNIVLLGRFIADFSPCYWQGEHSVETYKRSASKTPQYKQKYINKGKTFFKVVPHKFHHTVRVGYCHYF